MELSEWLVCYCLAVSDFVTPWTVAHRASLSMEFPWQEYWSGLPFPLPGDLPDPGIKPMSPALQVNSLPTEPPGKPWSSYLRACSGRVPETADGWGPSFRLSHFYPWVQRPFEVVISSGTHKGNS